MLIQISTVDTSTNQIVNIIQNSCTLEVELTLDNYIQLQNAYLFNTSFGSTPIGFIPDFGIYQTEIIASDTSIGDLQTPVTDVNKVKANILLVLNTREGTSTTGLGFTAQDIISYNYKSVMSNKINNALKSLSLDNLQIDVSRISSSSIQINIRFKYQNEYTQLETIYSL